MTKAGTKKANRKAKDDRYYEKNKEEIRRKNRERQQLARKVKKQKQLQEDLPPSSPPRLSREPSPQLSRTTRQAKPIVCSPKRTRRDSVDSIVDGMFNADRDYDYDDSHVVRDSPSPPPPALPSVICGTKQIPPTSDSGLVSNDIIEGWATLRTARLAIEKWTQPLGPLSGWAKRFRLEYDNACQADGDTQEAVDRFAVSVQEHIDIGRKILGEMYKSPIIRPPASTDAWADWLIAGDMLGTLHQGIAVLEAYLDILAPQCPVPSDSASGVRQWAGVSSLL